MSRVAVTVLVATIAMLSPARAHAQVAPAAITPSGLVMLPAPPAPAVQPDEAWLALGGVVDRARHDGGRLQVDVFGGRHWVLGVSGSLFEDADHAMSSTASRLFGSVYGAVTFRVVGPVHIRLQVGYGADAAAPSSRFFESAAFAHVEVGKRWAVVGGPIAQAASIEDAVTNPGTLLAFVGLQHR
jgi:hypothetical protein